MKIMKFIGYNCYNISFIPKETAQIAPDRSPSKLPKTGNCHKAHRATAQQHHLLDGSSWAGHWLGMAYGTSWKNNGKSWENVRKLER